MKKIIFLCFCALLASCASDEDLQEINTNEKELANMINDYELVLKGYSLDELKKEKEKYEEFPKGIHVLSYDPAGKMIGSIKAKYAKKLEDEMLWEARNEVVIINAEGKKLETELLYWDMKKELIYSDRYVKLSADGQIIEGNNGFHSDQNLNHPVFENISGSIEVEKQQRKQ